jgi:hypothetical protein
MGDPPGLIYPPGYGSGEIPPPITVYGDTRGVILLSRGWVWGVHTRWGFTHCQHYWWPIGGGPVDKQRRNGVVAVSQSVTWARRWSLSVGPLHMGYMEA